MNGIAELFRELIASAIKGGLTIALFGVGLLALARYEMLVEINEFKVEDFAWLAIALGGALVCIGALTHFYNSARAAMADADDQRVARQAREQARNRIIGNLELLDLHEKLLLLYVLQKPDGRINQILQYHPYDRLMRLGIIHDDTVEEGEENPDGYYPRGGVVRCAACVLELRDRIMRDIKPAIRARFGVDPEDPSEVARIVAINSSGRGDG